MCTVVAIPYRPQAMVDRESQLRTLLDTLKKLDGLHIVVAEQLPGQRFHRGALLNAAFSWSSVNCSMQRFVAHDCDLIPCPDKLRDYYSTDPFYHLASNGTVYDSPYYVGGVTLFQRDAFETMNGYPIAMAYGWGGEDDELRRRALATGVPITRSMRGTYQDMEGHGSLQEKLDFLKRHGLKNMERYELKDAHRTTWNTNGLRGSLQPTIHRQCMKEGVHWIYVDVPAM